MWHEYGIVKFFDGRNSRKYGFIRVLDDNDKETGEEIFFHFNDGELISRFEGNYPAFWGSSFYRVGGEVVNALGTPKKGEKVVFERQPGKEDKPKACPWGFAERRPLWGQFDPDDFVQIEDEQEDEPVSMGEVRSRINRHFGGNTEQAREAAEMYPGDFM